MNWIDVADLAVKDHGAMQDANELAILLGLLDSSLGPRSVLEIGRGNGGSTWAWSQLPSVELIVTVDQWRFRDIPAGVRPGLRVIQVQGDSHDDSTVAHVQDLRPDGGYDLVYIDGDHTLQGVAMDYASYKPMAAAWALIVLHDTRDDPAYPDHGVSGYWRWLHEHRDTTEIVSRPGGPFGTGIVWNHAASRRSSSDQVSARSAAGGTAAAAASPPGPPSSGDVSRA